MNKYLHTVASVGFFIHTVYSVCQSNNTDGAMGKIVIASKLFAYKFKK